MKVLIVDDDRAALYALSEVLTDVPAQLVRSEVMTLVGNAHGQHHKLA